MHFHLPQPLHGWREFAGEVGIIVIGVLIALAAEQMVETIHWRQTINAERKALDGDVEGMWGAMSARVVVQQCVDRRLDDLGLVFARHQRGQPVGIFAPLGRPAVFTGSDDALRMATADGSLSHMAMAEKQAYFGVATAYQTFAPTADEERVSWRELEALNDPEALDSTDWRELRKAYRDAVDSNHIMKAELVFGEPGQWLTPFERFRRMPETKEALTIPWVQQLCRPAVRR
jgi:hypothetical protein